MSAPHLYSINPKVATPTASILHTFPAGTGISGIAEYAHDKFAIVTAEWDLAATRAIAGTMKIWTVNLNGPAPVLALLTSITGSDIFNGLVRHPYNPHLLLAADSALGAVWRINVQTGAYSIAIQSPLLTSTATAHLGVNGLSAKGTHIYLTNSAQGLLAKVPLLPSGAAAGLITTISLSSAAGSDVVYDDLALDPTGRCKAAWIASHPDYAIGVFPNGDQVVVRNLTMYNPTAAAFGRGGGKERSTLYVTLGGRFDESWNLLDEGVVAIDLSRVRC